MAHDEFARRNTGSSHHRLDFTERVRGRPRIRRLDRHVGADCSGALMHPVPRQPDHVGALFGRKAATAAPDKDNDRLIGLGDDDRMAQPIIIGNACRRVHIVGMRAGAERDRSADQHPRNAQRAIAHKG